MAECRRSPEVQDNCAIGQILAAIEKEGVEFSDEELLDEVVMIVFASHDTTATSLMWWVRGGHADQSRLSFFYRSFAGHHSYFSHV